MKCPLLIIAAAVNNKRNMIEPADCLKEKCAWWDALVERCLWLNVSEKLSMIYLEMNEIRDKMPHEAQL